MDLSFTSKAVSTPSVIKCKTSGWLNGKILDVGCFESAGERGIAVEKGKTYLVDTCNGQYWIQEIDEKYSFIHSRQTTILDGIEPFIRDLKNKKQIVVLDNVVAKQSVIATYYDFDSGAFCLNKRTLINKRFCEDNLMPEVLARDNWKFVGDVDVAMVECACCGIRTMEVDNLSETVHNEDCMEYEKRSETNAKLFYDYPRLSENNQLINTVVYKLRTPKHYMGGESTGYCQHAVVVMEQAEFEKKVMLPEQLNCVRE